MKIGSPQRTKSDGIKREAWHLPIAPASVTLLSLLTIMIGLKALELLNSSLTWIIVVAFALIAATSRNLVNVIFALFLVAYVMIVPDWTHVRILLSGTSLVVAFVLLVLFFVQLREHGHATVTASPNRSAVLLIQAICAVGVASFVS